MLKIINLFSLPFLSFPPLSQQPNDQSNQNKAETKTKLKPKENSKEYSLLKTHTRTQTPH